MSRYYGIKMIVELVNDIYASVFFLRAQQKRSNLDSVLVWWHERFLYIFRYFFLSFLPSSRRRRRHRYACSLSTTTYVAIYQNVEMCDFFFLYKLPNIPFFSHCYVIGIGFYISIFFFLQVISLPLTCFNLFNFILLWWVVFMYFFYADVGFISNCCQWL